MDVVAACRAFVHVSERGSFTVGAAAARMSQSVASRRVAALEKHLGGQLFDRTPRRAVLTRFGRDVLPAARRLVRAADDLVLEAEAARRGPVRIAVPGTCSTGALARLAAAARGHGILLEPRTAAPRERAELVRTRQMRAALVAVAQEEAEWSVPLGLAGRDDPGVRRLHVETLRVGRTDTGPPRRIWLGPEDDVPHVRDRVARLCDAVGLRPAQLAVAADLASAAAEVLCSKDLLLCSPAQAGELGLWWCPVGGVELGRGFTVAAGEPEDAERIRTHLAGAVADCLGAHTPPGGGSREAG
ncbi:LysR family transcriptional regulator [Streptomyces sp. URMC 125]|uniref:LysR family transcriptional regulator n=2 Tax=Actinomycetes TaxID=1760 RepID=UPI003F192DF0